MLPWAEVSDDLIGPWTLNIIVTTNQEVFALTIIYTASNLVELVQIDNKTADNIARRFHNTLLSKYAQPELVIHGNGTDFKGYEFQGQL